MSFTIDVLKLRNYRNYSSSEFNFGRGISIITGHNAIGKTNIVESLRYLTMGESFRHVEMKDVIRWGSESGSASFVAHDGKRELTHEMVLGDKRTFFQNGKKIKAIDLCGTIPSVLFTPDDLGLVKNSAEQRRNALDDIGIQLSKTYRSIKIDYDRVVRQRNILLKDENIILSSLEPWTESLISLGSMYYTHRKNLFERLKSKFEDVYEQLVPAETATLEYVPSWERRDIKGGEDIAECMRRAEDELLTEECRRGISLIGPHRDEIIFMIDGRDARKFASQGQQRMLVLAWKLAEVNVMKDINDQVPLLLLDDVMSELDANRRSSFLEFISDSIQTIITTTNLSYFSDEMLEKSNIIKL